MLKSPNKMYTAKKYSIYLCAVLLQCFSCTQGRLCSILNLLSHYDLVSELIQCRNLLGNVFGTLYC
jgi:hypothetical protein